MKVLIIRFSSIGDIVLTTPVIRCLKKQLPNVEVHYLTKPQYIQILQNNPYIDKIWGLEKSLWNSLKKIKSQNFDLIVDLHNNLRTFVFKTFCNTQTTSFDKLNFHKFLIVNFKINILPKKHIVDRYLNTLISIGIVNDNEGLDYFFTDERFLPDEISKIDFCCIAIGGQHNTKKLPYDKIDEIISNLDCKVVLIGGKEDEIVAKHIEENFEEKIINYVGKLTISQSAFVIKHSKILITHDTGMMHIASALKKPIIAIWGNTMPEFGMYPYYGNNIIFYKNFEVLGLKCRPCSKIGFGLCPKKHFNCMKKQDTREIAKHAMNFEKL